jgi:lysozyme
MIKIDDGCINLIKSFEGFSSNAYHGEVDPPGVDTIGYGTILYPPTYMEGKRVKVGDPMINTAKATEFLKWEVMKKTEGVDMLIRDDLTVNQFGALVSFAYNVGLGALKGSTLRKKVNANPNDPTIRAEFMKWDMANGAHIKGLARRRQAEADLYFKPIV